MSVALVASWAICIFSDEVVHEITAALCRVDDGFEVANAARAPDRVLNAHHGPSL